MIDLPLQEPQDGGHCDAVAHVLAIKIARGRHERDAHHHADELLLVLVAPDRDARGQAQELVRLGVRRGSHLDAGLRDAAEAALDAEPDHVE